ncbi:ATPase AAA [Planoprotostelium fungivorum]|uniref:ATPase AAA n=1 Tax=Planoprotostelium fungivorum TaxID=1890364 RepID=A0A2P6NY19_9EUKA|nr:ATPase AAA [Planoprotostelium fungivorum]
MEPWRGNVGPLINTSRVMVPVPQDPSSKGSDFYRVLCESKIHSNDSLLLTIQNGEDVLQVICTVWPFRQQSSTEVDEERIYVDPSITCGEKTVSRDRSMRPVLLDFKKVAPRRARKVVVRLSSVQKEEELNNINTMQRKKISVALQRRIVRNGCTVTSDQETFTIHKVFHENSEEDSSEDSYAEITRSTDIVIEHTPIPAAEDSKKNPDSTLPIAAHTALTEMITLPLKFPGAFIKLGIESPKGILIKGVPGVGKTSLVRAVAVECGAKLFSINGAEVHGPYVGDSEAKLRSVFTEAVEHSKRAPSIVFIDEIDVLCPKRGDHNSNESRIVAQLLTLMDGLHSRGSLVVVAATNLPNILDPALRRAGRFDREIEIPIPDENERYRILTGLTKKFPVNFGEEDMKYLSTLLGGYVGADLSALCREVLMSRVRSGGEVMISLDDFMIAMKIVQPSTQRGASTVEVPNVKWEDIGGLSEAKKLIRQAVEWPLKFPDKFARFNLKSTRGILIHGPPGCSKTLLVKAVATSTNATFLSINGAAIYSPYVGDAEATIRELFKKARMGAPSIVFFDEIDAIVGKRTHESTSQGVEERVLSTILNEMDGVESSTGVMVIGATNRPDMLDAALLRPGRMDKRIRVSPPDEADRVEIFTIHTRKTPLSSDVDLASLASKTGGYSGADIENVCREAAMLALRRDVHAEQVMFQDFEGALRNTTKKRNDAPFHFDPLPSMSSLKIS